MTAEDIYWEGRKHFDANEYIAAVELLRKAADMGHMYAQRDLAWCCETGNGLPRDYEEAVKYYSLAAKQGDPYSKRRLGCFYRDGIFVQKDAQRAFEFFLAAANRGDGLACYNVAVCYETGFGVEVNLAEAYKFFLTAASKKHIDGMLKVGLCYLNGIGTKQNYSYAFDWLKRAVMLGNSEAMGHFAGMYENGLGVPQSYADAYYWYNKGAAKGDTLSQFRLGLLLFEGKGVKQDRKEALKWFVQAAENKCAPAQVALATAYETGKGVRKNSQEAFKWYHAAAQNGDAVAQYKTGLFYEKGCGTAVNEAKAFLWYQKSAEASNEYGMGALGLCYKYGRGTNVDLFTAQIWLSQAVEKGNLQVRRELFDLQQQTNPDRKIKKVDVAKEEKRVLSLYLDYFRCDRAKAEYFSLLCDYIGEIWWLANLVRRYDKSYMYFAEGDQHGAGLFNFAEGRLFFEVYDDIAQRLNTQELIADSLKKTQQIAKLLNSEYGFLFSGRQLQATFKEVWKQSNAIYSEVLAGFAADFALDTSGKRLKVECTPIPAETAALALDFYNSKPQKRPTEEQLKEMPADVSYAFVHANLLYLYYPTSCFADAMRRHNEVAQRWCEGRFEIERLAVLLEEKTEIAKQALDEAMSLLDGKAAEAFFQKIKKEILRQTGFTLK